MQGIGIESTINKISVSFDKEIFDEKTVLSWLEFIEIELLAKNIDFDQEILDRAIEIKSSIWEKEKKRIGINK